MFFTLFWFKEYTICMSCLYRNKDFLVANSSLLFFFSCSFLLFPFSFPFLPPSFPFFCLLACFLLPSLPPSSLPSFLPSSFHSFRILDVSNHRWFTLYTSFGQSLQTEENHSSPKTEAYECQRPPSLEKNWHVRPSSNVLCPLYTHEKLKNVCEKMNVKSLRSLVKDLIHLACIEHL